jgi:hypothetical protein
MNSSSHSSFSFREFHTVVMFPEHERRRYRGEGEVLFIHCVYHLLENLEIMIDPQI